MYCRNCNYDLRSSETGPCPECGAFFDRDDPSTFRDAQWRERRRRVWISVIVALIVGVGYFSISYWQRRHAFLIERADPNSDLFFLGPVWLEAGIPALMRSWLIAIIVFVVGLIALHVASRRRTDEQE